MSAEDEGSHIGQLLFQFFLEFLKLLLRPVDGYAEIIQGFPVSIVAGRDEVGIRTGAFHLIGQADSDSFNHLGAADELSRSPDLRTIAFLPRTFHQQLGILQCGGQLGTQWL